MIGIVLIVLLKCMNREFMDFNGVLDVMKNDNNKLILFLKII